MTLFWILLALGALEVTKCVYVVITAIADNYKEAAYEQTF